MNSVPFGIPGIEHHFGNTFANTRVMPQGKKIFYSFPVPLQAVWSFACFFRFSSLLYLCTKFSDIFVPFITICFSSEVFNFCFAFS